MVLRTIRDDLVGQPAEIDGPDRFSLPNESPLYSSVLAGQNEEAVAMQDLHASGREVGRLLAGRSHLLNTQLGERHCHAQMVILRFEVSDPDRSIVRAGVRLQP